MSTRNTTIEIDEVQVPFKLDFTTHRWSAEATLEECEFPLIAISNEKRYELYSDGTFAEEEL